MKNLKKNSLDPLFTIFEQHLYNNSQDSFLNRKQFVENVLKDYFLYLKKLNIFVPQSLIEVVTEELKSQVQVMLNKKTYGYMKIQDYQKKLSFYSKYQAKKQYSKMIKKA